MRSRMDMVRLAVGPVSLSLALAVGSCGSAVPVLAYADDALELVEDGESVEVLEGEVDPESEQVEGEPEPEPESEQVEGEPEPEPESEQVEGEPEPEPESEQVEGEPEPESTDRDAQIEQTATTDGVLEHIDAATERLDAAVDLLMIAAGGIGAILGTIAFGKLWGPLAGER